MCWGASAAGQMTTPAGVIALRAICAGGRFSCGAVDGSGAVQCWGDPAQGATAVPPSLAPGPHQRLAAMSLTCGWYGACALASPLGGAASDATSSNTTEVVCWGASGALAIGAASGLPGTPLTVTAPGGGSVLITSGSTTSGGGGGSGSGAISLLTGAAATSSGAIVIGTAAGNASSSSSGGVMLATGAAAQPGAIVLAPGGADGSGGGAGAVSLLAPLVSISDTLAAGALRVGNVTLTAEALAGLLALLQPTPVPSLPPK